MSTLKKVALALYRLPREVDKTTQFARDRKKILVFISFFLLLTLIFVSVFAKELLQWSDMKPDVSIPNSAWSYLFHDSTVSCDRVVRVNAKCLASPENSELWSSLIHRPDRVYEEKKNQLNGNPFWLGLTISQEKAAAAYRVLANQLIIGIIKNPYTVWVDGEYYSEGNRSEYEPIVLTLPISKLKNGDPIRIAIRIHPQAGTGHPDVKLNGFGQGLASLENKSKYLNLVAFTEKIRPLSFFFIDVMGALLFFLFWTYGKEKQEYFYVSVFSLICAAVQLKMSYIFYTFSVPSLRHSVHILARVLEGFFGLILGISFSRTKKIYFQIGIPVGLILGLALGTFTSDENAKINIMAFLDYWTNSIGCAFGSIFCFIQASYLISVNQKEKYFQDRIKRLVLFGLGLLGSAGIVPCLILFSKNGNIADVSQIELVSRFGQLGLIAFLLILAAIDLREQKKLLEKTPVSKYHRRPELVQKVSGAMLVVDLKNSEALMRLGDQMGESGKFVETCLSYMWNSILRHQGVLLSTEGDLIRAFFDQDVCKSPLLNALKSTDDMMKNLSVLKYQFEDIPKLFETMDKIYFRGGIALGDIKPVWQEVGDTRYASWIETGNTHPFLESARFVEIERKFAKTPPNSQIVIAEAYVKQIDSDISRLKGGWILRNQIIAGKHNREYFISIYDPGAVKEP